MESEESNVDENEQSPVEVNSSDDSSVQIVIEGGEEHHIVRIDAQPTAEHQNATENQAQNENQNPIENVSQDEDVTPSKKKRKRSLSKKQSPKKMVDILNEDDDDGSTCPICLDNWELGGEHRLISLKCGHLFGENCIKRWIQECPANARCCPTCKSKAMMRDMRALFVKRVQAVDKSEEYRLRDMVEAEKARNVDLQTSITTLRLELAILKEKYAQLERQMDVVKAHGSFMEPSSSSAMSYSSMQQMRRTYRMSLERNIEINREAGSRAMVYGRRTQMLFVSQKSNGTLFQGFGIRFMDAHTLSFSSTFLHMSAKQIRDLALDADEELIVSASMDRTVKMYSIPNKCQLLSFTPNEHPLWAATFDKTRTKNLLLGSQRGSTFLYDIRNSQEFIEEFKTLGDFSPVISIISVPTSDDFPFGGFMVCKLQSLWFYEYSATHQITPTKLIVEGPFVSACYDDKSNNILISTRPSTKYPSSRYIIANLIRIDSMIVLNAVNTIYGSRTQTLMTRSTLIKTDRDILASAYLQDNNLLTTWNAMNGDRLQALTVTDTIIDTCPIYSGSKTFLAALSETKCRIFEINLV